MKFRKIISVLCAVCMLCSALPVASAAEAADPISEYAGQSIVCQVFEETGGELTSRFITVYIPEGATRSEESAVAFQAAFGPQSRAGEHIVNTFTSLKVTITDADTLIGYGTAKHNYERIVVDINIDLDKAGHPLPELDVWCQNDATGISSDEQHFRISTVTQKVIFYSSDIKIYSGNAFSVYAKTSFGSLPTTSCYTQAATF